MKKISPVATKAVPLRMFKLLAEKLNEVIHRGNDIVEQVEALKPKQKSSKKKGTNMKKYLILIITILLTAGIANGATYAAFLRGTGVDGTTIRLNSQKQIEIVNMGLQFSSGKTYYVDSATGDAASNGETWVTAMATIDQAINRAAARVANGTDLGKPIIYVRESHNDGISTDSAIDADVAGMIIHGLGSGPIRPTIDFDANIATFVVGASGVTLSNLIFRPSVTSVSSGVVIEANANGTRILNCDFGVGEAAADEFITGLNINTSVSDTIVRGCRFLAATNAASCAIYFGTIDGLTLEDSDLIGDYAGGCIFNVGAADNIIIRRSLLFNGGMEGDGDINAVAAINIAEGTSGLVSGCDIVSDVGSVLLMRIADDMVFMNNIVSDTDGDEFSGTIEAGPTPPTTTSYATSTVSTVSGHIDG